MAKKEEDVEKKLNDEIIDIEEKVGFNNKWTWILSIVVALVVLAIFLILHYVSGVL